MMMDEYEHGILPTLTPFDFYPPAMNARLILIFELEDGIDTPVLEHALGQGIEYIYSRFPLTKLRYLSQGSRRFVCCTGAKSDDDQNFSLYHAKGNEPTFQKLKERGAPLNDIVDVFAPAPRYPTGNGLHPIFEFKATRIEGGLILCFSVHHQAVDGTGIAVIALNFAKRCREVYQAYTSSEATLQPVSSEDESTRFEVMQAAHADIIARTRLQNPMWKGIEEEKSIPAPPALTLKRNTPEQVSTTLMKPRTCIFLISADRLPELKHTASAMNSQDPTATQTPHSIWISTNDAIFALIMHCITQARQVNPLAKKTVNAHITVNARQKLDPPLPANYLGNCVVNTVAALTTNQILQTDGASLAATAQSIRTAIASVNDDRVRHVAAWIKAQPNPDSIDFDWSYYGGMHDYGLISWAGMGHYDLDFGFGHPAYVRLPASAFSNSCRILPRRRDGSQEIIIGLEEEDMARLRENKMWCKWVKEVAV